MDNNEEIIPLTVWVCMLKDIMGPKSHPEMLKQILAVSPLHVIFLALDQTTFYGIDSMP